MDASTLRSNRRHLQTAEDPGAIFQHYRERLWGIAYGIVSSPEDADELVQEAYLRWHGTNRKAVRNPEAFLVTAITRLAIDRLRVRKTERSVYVGPWLPTPVVDPAPSPDTRRRSTRTCPSPSSC